MLHCIVRCALGVAVLMGLGAVLPVGRYAKAQGYVPGYMPMEIIHDFGVNEPGGSTAGLIFDKAGNLYGTEANGNGAVFELSPPGWRAI